MDTDIGGDTMRDTDEYREGINIWELGICGVSRCAGEQGFGAEDWETDLHNEEEVCEQLQEEALIDR